MLEVKRILGGLSREFVRVRWEEVGCRASVEGSERERRRREGRSSDGRTGVPEGCNTARGERRVVGSLSSR